MNDVARSHPPRTLSILVPVYNERATILAVLDRLGRLRFPIPAEIVVVDDGSTDGTRELLLQLNGKQARYPARVFFHTANRGKGAAVRTAMQHARGDVLVIQDADLELDSQDIVLLLEAVLKDGLEVCYGSRFLRPDRGFYLLPTYWANRFLNLLSNLINRIWITDFNTCYKMFTARVKDRLDLKSRGFAMEAEITTKLARMGVRIHERPIHYQPRSRNEGKKIRARDFFDYVRAMIYFRLAPMPRRAASPVPESQSLRLVAVTSPGSRREWPVIDELQEAWDALWRPALREAPETEAPASVSDQGDREMTLADSEPRAQASEP